MAKSGKPLSGTKKKKKNSCNSKATHPFGHKVEQNFVFSTKQKRRILIQSSQQNAEVISQKLFLLLMWDHPCARYLMKGMDTT